MLRCTELVVRDPSELSPPQAQWNDLAAACEPSSAFLSHEWMQAAAAWVQSEGSELHVLAVYRGEHLIGICPLASRVRAYRGLRVRGLEFLSVPDSQHCDILCAPHDAPDVAAQLVSHLHRKRHDWDVLEFDKLRLDSGTLPPLATAFSAAGFRVKQEPGGVNPGFALTGGWEAYYKRRSRRLKKGNNLIANHLRRDFDDIEVHWLHGQGLSPLELTQGLDALVAVSAACWKQRTGLTLEQPAPGAFIRRLSDTARRNGWLSIWLLLLDGKPVATEYQLIDDGQVFALRADFDQAYEQHSPGTYLNREMLERLFDAGLAYYHMGPGENSYKLRWAEEHTPLGRLVVYGRSVRGRLLARLKLQIIPLLDTLSRSKSKASAAPPV